MACIDRHRCRTCPRPCKSEIQEEEFKKWYTSLTVEQKSDLMDMPYPACTTIWNSMRRDERIAMIEKSGIIRKVGNKFTALGHDF